MKGINKLFIVCAGLLLAACSSGLPNENRDESQEKGEPVKLSFKMYNADLTKALGATNAVVDMVAGTKITILAYAAGTQVDNLGKLPAPLGRTVTEIKADLTADGNMTLYRGQYDLYFLSYNNSIAPNPDGGEITVDNGYDFMYSELKGLTVQPENDGKNEMTVSMTSPFIRLGSQVTLSVKAKDSPVNVIDLQVQKITMKNLSTAKTYYLGEENWQSSSDYSGEYTVSKFSYVASTPKADHTSDPIVLLPVDGTSQLEFELVLDVTYKVAGETTETKKPFTYTAKTSKALLKGMKYSFTFTLTFFGVLNPGDITISLLDYTNNNQATDDVGE
ncbi:fimbrillin family protein [Parabacteroides sp.]